jgi:hypothetical protein
MNESNQDKFEQDLRAFATRHSANRLKISTYSFDRDYKCDYDGQLQLVSEKAIIRSLGKVTKVPIGENEKFSTYQEAEQATKKYWQEYYKNIRGNRSDAQKLAEGRRQKRYREKRKADASEFESQQ